MKNHQKGYVVPVLLFVIVLLAIFIIYPNFQKAGDNNPTPYEPTPSTPNPEMMSLNLYIQDKDVARTSDCGVTKKVTYQIPRTVAVADASLEILFAEGGELAEYGQYKSVVISNSVAKVQLESDNTPSGSPIGSLSSCQVQHLTSVMHDTLTQYPTIKSVELYSPSGKIEF